ncbi:MAG: hypothetical protein IIY31_03700, partial [Desulfovibrio sp.]|nr:hypothetical protein [Desulfovibrio sp.]
MRQGLTCLWLGACFGAWGPFRKGEGFCEQGGAAHGRGLSDIMGKELLLGVGDELQELGGELLGKFVAH